MLYPDSGDVLGQCGEQPATRRRVVAALRETLLQVSHDVVVPGDVPADEEEERAGTWRSRRERFQLRLEQLGQASLLACDLEIRRELEHALVAAGVVVRRQPQRVLGKLGGGLRRAASGGAGRAGGHPGCKRGVGPERAESEVTGLELDCADDVGQLEMELTTLGRLRLTHRGRGQQGMGRANIVAFDDEHAGLDGRVEGVRIGKRHELSHPHGRAEGDREQHASYGWGQAGHACAEQVLDGGGNGKVLPGRGQAVLPERAAELEGEERIAERRLVQAAKHMPREAQAEALGEDVPDRSEARRPQLAAREAFSSSARSSSDGSPGRRASRNATGSAASRRTAKARASSEGRSSHWTSSTATRSGRPAASERSALSAASATACASGGCPVGSAR